MPVSLVRECRKAAWEIAADLLRARVMPIIRQHQWRRTANELRSCQPIPSREMLDSLGLRVIPLRQESDIHAFSALGPALPIALTFWENSGNNVDDLELLETAKKFSLPDYPSILQ